MKPIALAALLFGGISLYADVIPVLTSVTPESDGTFLWNYSVDIAADQQLQPMASNCDPSLGANCTFGDAMFLFDFGGLVYDMDHPVSSPTGWGANIVQSGAILTTYGQGAPVGTTTPELEFYDYTATAVTGTTTICCFSAFSTSGTMATGVYNGQGTKFAPGLMTNGTIQGNQGAIATPTAAPEPGTLFMLGGALVGLALFRRKYRTN